MADAPDAAAAPPPAGQKAARVAPFAQVATALQRDGFAVARGCVDGEALLRLVEEYERKCVPLKHSADVRREKNGDAGPDGLPRVVHVSNVIEAPELASLAADPTLLRLASECLGCSGVRPVINTEIFDKPPRGNGSTHTPPHQDNFYFRSPLPGVALWVAVEPMADDAGTVRFVHGSHRRGLRFHEFDWGPYGGFAKQIFEYTDEDDALERQIGALQPGDVVIHHALTVHHAPPNMTASRRRGLVVNYVPERAANALADDLYQPALEFSLSGEGRLTAPLPPEWPERHALAAACVRCALAGWSEGAIPGSVHVDAAVGKLAVELGDAARRPDAIAALVASGHVIHGVGRAAAGGAAAPACGGLPAEHAGAWALESDSTSAWRLLTASGAYVELRLPGESVPLEPAQTYDEEDFKELLRMASQEASGGRLSAAGASLERFGLHPATGNGGAQRVRAGEGGAVEVERGGEWERWRRVGAAEEVCVLDLVDDAEGRQGLWLVVGGWFGRIVGRPSSDMLADIACRSLPHALATFAERWGLDPASALVACEAAVGRVEAPGVLRAAAELRRPDGAGCELQLDGEARQLRRDAERDDVLVEAWSGRRWRVREMPPGCEALGRLKRAAAA